jgi:hypothetical protein
VVLAGPVEGGDGIHAAGEEDERFHAACFRLFVFGVP